MKATYYLFGILVLVFPTICWSESLEHEPVAPSIDVAKNALLPYWEKTIREDPQTKLFEKTAEPGIYRIQTSVLPYDGRVKVLNVVVDHYQPVGNYDEQVAYGGVIETELMDAPKNIAVNQPFSFKNWQHLGWFSYDTATGWFPFNDWNKHFPLEKRGEARKVGRHKTAPGI
jgi:hypothetical protein